MARLRTWACFEDNPEASFNNVYASHLNFLFLTDILISAGRGELLEAFYFRLYDSFVCYGLFF